MDNATNCKYCGDRIEVSDHAACGYRHSVTQQVMCRPRDATPEYISESARYDAMLKRNLLRLIEDHRSKCDENCTVTLFFVREIAERAGFTFTDEERNLFF